MTLLLPSSVLLVSKLGGFLTHPPLFLFPLFLVPKFLDMLSWTVGAWLAWLLILLGGKKDKGGWLVGCKGEVGCIFCVCMCVCVCVRGREREGRHLAARSLPCLNRGSTQHNTTLASRPSWSGPAALENNTTMYRPTSQALGANKVCGALAGKETTNARTACDGSQWETD